MEGYLSTFISGICALLFMGLGLPLANRRVPPNRWYGYRVSRYQYEDEEIWYVINARGGTHTVLAGVFSAVFCGFTLLFRGRSRAQSALMAAYAIFILGWAAYEISWSVREARRMARERGLLGKGGSGS
ncbi:MAG: hypothetical protein H5T74_10890 [Actinobacteria bacterium]|nr:hypothetical protein [Actinomycetota bacterium]MDI6830894.1 hypothetical protein [Actinomycetota bacterium]